MTMLFDSRIVASATRVSISTSPGSHASAGRRSRPGTGVMIVGARRPSIGTMLAARHEQWGLRSNSSTSHVEPAAGEVRIAIKATSVNPIDMHTGRNAGYEQSMQLPSSPDGDVSGVVDALGYGVTRYAVGDRLFGLASFPSPAGTYAEYMTPVHAALAPVPASSRSPRRPACRWRRSRHGRCSMRPR